MKRILIQIKLLLVIVVCMLTTSIFGATYYVATNGNDNSTSPTNPNYPWQTIQKAANTVPGGSTVIISGGTYYEKVTISSRCNGSSSTPTVFQSKSGETAIINGNNAGYQWEALLALTGVQYVTVKGIKATNGYWYGFSATNNCSNIIFDGCITYNTRASGIYVHSSSYVTVKNNKIQKACQEPNRDVNDNGTQECMSIVASHNFYVFNNEVWGTTFAGAGGEGIDAKGGSYTGEIFGNYLHDLYRVGIYLDAGSGQSSNIKVFNNKLTNTGGMSIAGELGGFLHDIYIYNNVIRNSSGSGLLFQSIGNGKYGNIYFVNNTLYNNGTSGFNGDVACFSENTGNYNLVIKNNVFYNKTSNYRFSIWHTLKTGFSISNNLYYDFKASNNGSNSFTADNLTSADVLTNPLFNSDLSLQSTSPAHGKGLSFWFFNNDYYSNPRSGSAWDLGAFETASGGGSGAGTNLISNPKFDNDLNGWSLYLNGGSATASRIWSNLSSSWACKLAVTAGGSSTSAVNYRTPINIVSGERYTIKFRAWALASRNIDVVIQKSASPYNIRWAKWSQAITTTPTDYGPFTFNSTSSEAALFSFWVGLNASTVYIDNIEVIDGDLKSAVATSDAITGSSKIGVYPNPADDRLNVTVSAAAGEEIVIDLIDIQGQLVLRKSTVAEVDGQNTIDLNVQSLSQGTYLVKVITGSDVSTTKLVIK